MFNWSFAIISFPKLGQNIGRPFHVLAQFLFTTSKTELDYYHQKVIVRVASQVVERLKVAVTDVRYFSTSKLSRSLVHKKNFKLT